MFNKCILSSLGPGICFIGARDGRSRAALRCDIHLSTDMSTNNLFGKGMHQGTPRAATLEQQSSVGKC